MREKTITCSVYLMFGNCAVLAVLLLVVGCELSLPKTQGQAARETLSQSRARMLELETAFSNTMASLKGVLALQMLIDDEKSISHYNQEYLKTNTFSIAQYNALDIAPLLGTYTENAQGSYDFNAGLQRIVVHKLSGITIEVFDFLYDNDNRVAQYSLTVTPAGATPQTDKVTISLILYRLNALDWFHHGPSSGIRIEGSVTTPSATPTPYQFDIVQSIGMLGGQNLVSEPFVRSGKRLVITDRTEGLASTKTFKEEKVLSHEPSDTAGVWVADFVYDHFQVWV